MNGPGFGVGLGLGLGLVDGATEGPPETMRRPADGARPTIDPDARGEPATASWVGVAVPAEPRPECRSDERHGPVQRARRRGRRRPSAIAIDPTRRVRLVRGRLYMIVTVPATRRLSAPARLRSRSFAGTAQATPRPGASDP